MLKQKTTQITLIISLGLCALATGIGLGVMQRKTSTPPSLEAIAPVKSELSPLLFLSPADRSQQLQQLAAGSTSLDRHRARYLLATDLLQQKQPEAALKQLEGLEKDFPTLNGYILLKRAQAAQMLGNEAQAKAALTQILPANAELPVAAEALYLLGKDDRQYWQQAIAQFPNHPRTAEIANALLPKASSAQAFPLLKVLATHLYLPNIGATLDRLSANYSAELTPADWETIAFGYWEKQDYAKAGRAYAKATVTPRNRYRVGRGLQLGDFLTEATVAYKQVLDAFPETEEAGLALMRLGKTSKNLEAIAYLDRIIADYPDRAAEALLEKANRLDRLNNSKSASQARQSILTQYSSSESAAELRWKTAQGLAKAGNLAEAWQWAQQLSSENPQSPLAPQAAFWVGKWAQRLGYTAESQKSFEYVLANYPESYYAWRSAVNLGWDVGDFNTVRNLSPEVIQPHDRIAPMVGSEALQELYLLGQYRDAWSQWQVEFINRMDPSVAEQFTDGLLRMGVGDYLDGIFMLTHLAQREKPEEREQYQAIRSQIAYWEALYPFPYMDLILSWSEKRQVNPLISISIMRQESRFTPTIRSVADAVGLMQVLPETGSWIADKYKEAPPKSLTDPNDNIRLGTLYLAYTHKVYSDNSLFAIASYNAGPGSVDDWKKRFDFSDPDEFVTKIPFPETNDYISSVFGNYWNYLRLFNPEVKKKMEEF